MRYYYKNVETGFPTYNLKSPLKDTTGYIQITAAEWNELTKPVAPEEIVPTEEDIKRARIAELKKLLKDTDYQAIKFAEGWISAEDYAEMKILRQTYRDEINRLEAELAG